MREIMRELRLWREDRMRGRRKENARTTTTSEEESVGGKGREMRK